MIKSFKIQIKNKGFVHNTERKSLTVVRLCYLVNNWSLSKASL